jgi:LPS export ABC transporter protein LptC
MKQQKYVFDKFFPIKNSHNIKAGIVTLIVVTMLFLSCSKGTKPEIPKDNYEELSYPAIDATDFELTFTENGIVRYHLNTPRLIKFETKEKPYTEFPDGFHITKFNEDEETTSELSANYGKNFEKEHRWEAIGNVIAINSGGDTLRTEHLILLEKEDRIYSDKYVRITGKDRTITGIGFESDHNMDTWVVKTVKGTIYTDTE